MRVRKLFPIAALTFGQLNGSDIAALGWTAPRTEAGRPPRPSRLLDKQQECRIRERTATSVYLYGPSYPSTAFYRKIPLVRMDEGQMIYESACQEGNYLIVVVLAGARRQEADEQ